MAPPTGLDPKAVQAADKAFWDKHSKDKDPGFWEKHPDGKLTMSADGSEPSLRAEWMNLYKKEVASNAGGAGGACAVGSGAACAPAPAPAPAGDKLAEAITQIENSKFAKTEEGKKVVAKIQSLQKDGKINFKNLRATTRGQWGGGEITVNESYKNDTDAIASELVHEATHALNEDEFPASKTKVTIDEEMRTNKNQLDLYEEQRTDGFRDPELDRRRRANADGKLRDDVRSRYPGVPESL